MTDDYTPTTEQVRDGHRESGLGDGSYMDQDEGRALNEAAFDRWLEAHDRQVKAQAWHEGFCRGEVSGQRELPLNPYTENPYKEQP